MSGLKWITGQVITFDRMNQKTLIVQAAEPAVMYEGMLWFDIDDDKLKERNAADNAWIERPGVTLAATISGLWTFDRGAAPPFAVDALSTRVVNLIADVHAPEHKDGGADELDVSELAGAIGGAGEVPETDGAAVTWVDPDLRYDPKLHAPTHKDGGTDELDVSELAGAIGGAGEIPETDGAAVTWVEPDSRYDPKAHILGTGGPHTGTLPLVDIEVGAQGEVIIRGAVDWEALAVGADGQTLKSGGAAADPSWTWNKELDPEPDATDTGNGITSKDVVGEIVIAGDVLYMKADGKYWKADADGAATMPAKVMAMEGGAADATIELLHIGYYREDSRWNWTVGNGAANLLYVHTTAGDMVQLAGKPSGSGDQLQVVGYVVTPDIVFFNPSLVLAEIV